MLSSVFLHWQIINPSYISKKKKKSMQSFCLPCWAWGWEGSHYRSSQTLSWNMRTEVGLEGNCRGGTAHCIQRNERPAETDKFTAMLLQGGVHLIYWHYKCPQVSFETVDKALPADRILPRPRHQDSPAVHTSGQGDPEERHQMASDQIVS